MDFFFVEGKPYLHTKGRQIKFMTVHAQTSRGKKETYENLLEVTNLYTVKGIAVTLYRGDNEFRMLERYLRSRVLSIVGRKEHVSPIERSSDP